ncbi:hypothetical protein EV210_101187 [Anaerospora hongkongensis]|uniref:Uncharacterized protein n=1 Tax=Anaerospora hongkongensis TaxID=244830 RepID=A0A4R1Q2E2_9FIRM|nr:hypothetical protein [Anaerospora hongkongensis]TCL39987.1 hypothetical protein EV210_101187 [Anaerospora hongkongensis]
MKQRELNAIGQRNLLVKKVGLDSPRGFVRVEGDIRAEVLTLLIQHQLKTGVDTFNQIGQDNIALVDECFRLRNVLVKIAETESCGCPGPCDCNHWTYFAKLAKDVLGGEEFEQSKSS